MTLEHGGWIQTFTGKKYSLLNPQPEAVDIMDIAHALSMICRYTGHIDRFYSVAEHSFLLSYQVPEEFALEGLLHDATEAYVNDLSKPLKELLPEYNSIEAKHYEVISRVFGIPPTMSDTVKEADARMLMTEHHLAMKPAPDTWGYPDIAPYPNLKLLHMNPQQACSVFISRYFELEGRRSLRNRLPGRDYNV